MMDLLSLSDNRRAEVSEAGKKRAREKFSIETLGKELEEACIEVANMPDVQGQIGDKLMWGGAAMMGFAAVNLALLFLLYGFKAS
jgi:alpha-1,3/alpha-1,6-mannosyltransferase